MRSPWRDLATWLGRSRPTPGALAKAVASASAASLTGLALFVGAPYLLLESASTSRAVTAGTLAALLTGIELLAFARSPLRFAERMQSHELGLRAVSRWRRWLLVTVGAWPYRRWRDAAEGDLLERALGDTDVLQDLWLRATIPSLGAVTALVLGDLLVALLPGGPVHRPAAVAALLIVLACSVVVTVAFLTPVTAAERHVRSARAARTAALVDAQGVAVELGLLSQSQFLQSRLDRLSQGVVTAERRRDRLVRVMRAVTMVVPLGGVVVVSRAANGHAALFGRSDLVVLLLAAAAADVVAVVRASVEVVAQVSAATERLDALAADPVARPAPWPPDATLSAHDLSIPLGTDRVIADLDLTVAPGGRLAVTGPIGSGKSSLLRALASLDEPTSGSVTVGGTELSGVEDRALRSHLGYVSADPRLTTGRALRVLCAGRNLEIDVAHTMRELGMTATNDTRWEHLSRGEVVRVALARQLASEPAILLLDEPTSGLGPDEREAVLARLRRYPGSLVCATHDPDLMAECDDILAL